MAVAVVEGARGRRRARSSAPRPATPPPRRPPTRRARGSRRSCSRPAGAIAAAKLAQARAVGARLLEVRGQLRRGAAALPRARPSATGFVLVNSLNPDRIEGQKTAVVRDRRAARPRARRPRAALTAAAATPSPYAQGFAEDGVAAADRSRRRPPSARRRSPPRSGSPSRPTCARGRGARRRRARVELVTVSDEDDLRDAGCELAQRGGHLLRAGVGRRARRARAPARARAARPSSASSRATG